MPPPEPDHRCLSGSRPLRRSLAACLGHAVARPRRLRLRRDRGHGAPGADLGGERADAQSARPDLAGLALGAVDRLGAAVHPVVWNLRDIQSGADRRRRVLPCLSRRGAGAFFRSIASWWRSGAPSGSRALPWPGASLLPGRSCRKPLTALRFGARASASCSSSRRNSWVPRRGSAILLVDGQQMGL